MTAAEQLQRWAELADAATDGPWDATHGPREHPKVWGSDAEDADPLAVIYGFTRPDDGTPDARFIAASRTAVPAMTTALTSVLEHHQPQERCHNGEGSWSVTRDVWAEDYDGEPEVFLVCAHCGAIEMHESTEDFGDHSYLDSLWPCPTVAAIETALEVAS